ncbi:hypothetical protein B7R54_15140 [Subtercola boreus]|uniref:Uncharacterized protein n=1 Tax=Subtercola boreus TaxID=120213 RepID=A0A3E0VKZ6_9MICO|nr:hypothetical protein [Subtercola boreus]RFA10391.1 hypothetical protein B7R54_15140 [Subtercola boreus]TQL56091.1 hypothetical protein FB464_3673 [Subtercola boreus]
MSLLTSAQTQEIVVKLVQAHLEHTAGNMFHELVTECVGETPFETLQNVSSVATAAIIHISYILTIPGGQGTADALHILSMAPMWAALNDIEQEMPRE